MSEDALSPSIHSLSLSASFPSLPRPNLLFCRSSFGVTLSRFEVASGDLLFSAPIVIALLHIFFSRFENLIFLGLYYLNIFIILGYQHK